MPGPGGRGRGQPKGESHAGPGRQADGAQGSGTRPNPVAAGGPRRGQATSSVVHSAAQVMTGLVSSGLSLLADTYAPGHHSEKDPGMAAKPDDQMLEKLVVEENADKREIEAALLCGFASNHERSQFVSRVGTGLLTLRHTGQQLEISIPPDLEESDAPFHLDHYVKGLHDRGDGREFGGEGVGQKRRRDGDTFAPEVPESQGFYVTRARSQTENIRTSLPMVRPFPDRLTRNGGHAAGTTRRNPQRLGHP